MGSGLPLEQLLTDLRTSENQALSLIKTRYDATQNRISAYGTLKNAVENVKTAAEALNKSNTLGALKATTTGDTFTASAGGKAIAGDYRIEVQQLAGSQTLVSAGQADRKASLGNGGLITFTFGDGKQSTLDLQSQATSLEDLVAAINADTDLGVRATLVNDGSDTPHRLLLTSAETGTDAALSNISVSSTDLGNSLQALLGFDATQPSAMEERVAATNALIDVNGISITSQSNKIEQAIEGVTLELAKAGTAQSLKIARDDSAGTAAVKGFVSAYNALQSTLTALTGFNVDEGTSSPLTGDSIARRVQSLMRDALGVTATEGQVRSLSQMGISTDPSTGALKVDDAKLSKALAENLPDVQRLLSGEGGLVQRVTSTVQSITGSNGMIKSATDGAERSAKLLDNDYIATSERIDQRMETYRAQFVALDQTVAQMSSISNYLTQQLAMLSNLNSQSSKS
ncbi:flagellar filament capping protein FliD [Pusillimonas sp. CC-YST705]|uniref:Flagellar hook-associated protein 2 n=1 Tax=Mesopusillimonas faecipullorum TaxID=2755040 RepID=A0ABS8CA04_9BURK|nr:flagellar filament capping protein FliD [Mesopusillimonas faecipullorum]